jgi:hypothetical protein
MLIKPQLKGFAQNDYPQAVKDTLLEIDAVLSNATAELSMPNPNAENAKRGVDVARDMILKLAEDELGRDPLLEAKRKLVLIYLGMTAEQISDLDTEIFSLLVKDRTLKNEIERARKNN